ncbi:lipopolysaccharide biosynthesis protein [Clostridiaceae bacterium]|nr:lipopolysaccharide biosynthesis protein [Clostridiaceae bacterium]
MWYTKETKRIAGGFATVPQKNTMTRDAMLFLPAKIAEGLLLMLVSSLYSHIFLKEANGFFNSINLSIQLCYLILAGWMANAATRYVAEEYRTDKGEKLFSTVSTVYLLLCALVSAGYCVTALTTGRSAYFLAIPMFMSYTCFQILNAALVQLGRIRASVGLSLLSALMKLGVAYALVGGAANFPSPAPALLAAIAADGIAGLGAALVLSFPQVVRLRYFSKALLQKFLKYGVPLMGVSISVALLNQIDRILVVNIYGDGVFAVYSNNNSIATSIFNMLSVGIMRGVYPNVLRAWREGGQALAKPLLDSGVRLYLLIAAPAVCGLSALAYPLSDFLFAEGYEAGFPVIIYTSCAMLFMGLTEYANKAYELEQQTSAILQNSAAAAVIKVIASIILIRTAGYLAAALGSVIAFASYFLLTAIRVRKRFLFRIAPASLVKILLSSALCGAAAFGCTHLPVSNLLRLVSAVVAGAATYAVCIAATGEGKAEIAAIRAKLQSRLR